MRIHVDDEFVYHGRLGGLVYYGAKCRVTATNRSKKISDIAFRDGKTINGVLDSDLKEK